jgi:carbon starvation protein
MGKQSYAWVTLLPMLFVATATLSAGYLSIRDNFLPMTRNRPLQGWLDAGLTSGLMAGVVIILADSTGKWLGWSRAPARIPNLERRRG